MLVAVTPYCAQAAQQEFAATHPTHLACLYIVLKQTSFDGEFMRRFASV